MAAGPLSARVLWLCDAALSELNDGPSPARVRRVRDGLRQPLRIVLAGRLKAGKSTLVNALLRQRIAPTDIGECTKVVTAFRYAPAERVEVLGRDGDLRVLPLQPDGSLPTTLGLPPEDIESVTVWLANDVLQGFTVIDTPGLSSINEQYSAATERFLALDEDSRTAIARADALVYLMPHLAEGEDLLLRGFRELCANEDLSSVNAIGVISKIDLAAGDSANPLRFGHTLADRYSRRLHAEVASVLPVIGLLAETARTDVFTEADAADLREIARLDELTRDEVLFSADWFVDSDRLSIPRERRTRLLALLDLYGIRRAVEFVAAGDDTAQALTARFLELSGFDALLALLTDVFGARADAVKAHVALTDLERLSYTSDDPQNGPALRALRDAIENLRFDPKMHQVNELDALRLRAGLETSLAPDLDDDLDRLARGAGPALRLGLAPDADAAAIARRALERATRWLEVVNDPRNDHRTVRLAELARDSMMLLWQDATG